MHNGADVFQCFFHIRKLSELSRQPFHRFLGRKHAVGLVVRPLQDRNRMAFGQQVINDGRSQEPSALAKPSQHLSSAERCCLGFTPTMAQGLGAAP